MRYFPLIFLIIVFVNGCMESREEAEKKILAYDPYFSNVIHKRNMLEEEIISKKNAYEKEIKSLEMKIQNINKEKERAKASYLESVQQIKENLESEKSSINKKLLDMRNELKIKSSEAKNISRDIKEVDALIEKKDRLEFTREEIQVWNRKLSSLVERHDRIQKDIVKLKEDIYITGLKKKVVEIN